MDWSFPKNQPLIICTKHLRSAQVGEVKCQGTIRQQIIGILLNNGRTIFSFFCRTLLLSECDQVLFVSSDGGFGLDVRGVGEVTVQLVGGGVVSELPEELHLEVLELVATALQVCVYVQEARTLGGEGRNAGI